MTLLGAWGTIAGRVPLKIVGDGPLRDLVVESANRMRNVQYLGALAHGEVVDLMKDAVAVVVPSLWYETFGLVVAEAFATGTPVVVSDHGALAELVTNDVNGFTFRPGDEAHLAEKVLQLWRDPSGHPALRQASRRTYDERFTAERSYRDLVAVYKEAQYTASWRRERSSNAAKAKRPTAK